MKKVKEDFVPCPRKRASAARLSCNSSRKGEKDAEGIGKSKIRNFPKNALKKAYFAKFNMEIVASSIF